MESTQLASSSLTDGLIPLTSLDQLPARFAWYAAMRETAPVFLDETTGAWHVFRYDDVDRVVSDYAVFSSENSLQNAPDAELGGIPTSMIATDPPRHRQLRGLVSQVFTPKAVSQLRPRIASLTQAYLDGIRPRGEIDLIRDFAYPLPVAVIADMLGIPTERRADFKRWSDAIVGAANAGVVEVERQRESEQATREMTDFFREVIAERRRRPGEDLISGLIAAQIEGQHLTVTELIGFCQLLLVAGNETTMNLIANAIVCFDEHPEAVTQLRREPELMPSAIEEVLRYLPSVWTPFTRRTTTEVELGNRRIPPDAMIFPWLVSANRDERQFPEPERFDIARKPNKHRTFGHGIHACLGAPLARLEAAIALPLLLEQLAGLRVVRDAPILVVDSGAVFGPKALPVTFTPA